MSGSREDDWRAGAEGGAKDAPDDADPSGDPFATGGALGGRLFRNLAGDLGAFPADLPEDPALDPLVGETVGAYRVEERLGIGGMGVVYRATDLQLSRQVALKFLPAHLVDTRRARERFEREARAVSALSHPNICVLHGVGEHRGRPYLVLELLEGETLAAMLLAGPLEPARALEIAIAVADGLQAAHDAGVLHRDVKPANLFVTRRGHVKILDFGIAKLLPHGEGGFGPDGEASDPGTLTQPGAMPGTFAYMSPEQLQGDDLDVRSDVFSLGVVLYEMLGGRPPFDGGSPGALIDAIVRGAAAPIEEVRPGLDPRLADLVGWAMATDRRRRVESAARLQAELEALRWSLVSGSDATGAGRLGRRWWRSEWRELVLGAVAVVAVAAVFGLRGCDARSPGALSVAVLPFEDLSPGETDTLVAATLPDELVGLLSRSRELAVRPLAESRRVTSEVVDGGADLAAAAARLGADRVVTGTIATRAGRLEVALQAVDADQQRVVWRERLSLDPDDLLSQREGLRQAVRAGLLPALGVGETAADTLPASAEAYRLYVESRAALGDPAPNRAAIAQLERAVELDPSFAPAWAQLGLALHIDGYYWSGDPGQMARARRAVERALELDADLIEAAGTLVQLRLESGDLKGAYLAAGDLVDRRPSSSAARVLMSVVLRYGGRIEAAVGECELARQLDPRDSTQRQCVLTYLWAGLEERALEAAGFATSLLWENDVTARIALRNGRREEAARLWSRQASAEAGLLRRDSFAACLRGESGDPLDRRLTDAYEQVRGVTDPEWWFASAGLFATCGRSEWALGLLRSAATAGYCVDPSPQVQPLLGPLADRLGELRASAASCREGFESVLRARR